MYTETYRYTMIARNHSFIAEEHRFVRFPQAYTFSLFLFMIIPFCFGQLLVLDIPHSYVSPYTGVFPKTSFIFQDAC